MSKLKDRNKLNFKERTIVTAVSATAIALTLGVVVRESVFSVLEERGLRSKYPHRNIRNKKLRTKNNPENQ